MYKVKVPGLYYKSIPNRMIKDIILPDIYIGNMWALGGYYKPTDCISYIEEREVDFINGVIVLSEKLHRQGEEESTFFHEFRHHVQALNGKLNLPIPWSKLPGDNYSEQYINYWILQPDELDALIFEYKYAKSKENEENLVDVAKKLRISIDDLLKRKFDI